jgi:hypothetical protein
VAFGGDGDGDGRRPKVRVGGGAAWERKKLGGKK